MLTLNLMLREVCSSASVRQLSEMPTILMCHSQCSASSCSGLLHQLVLGHDAGMLDDFQPPGLQCWRGKHHASRCTHHDERHHVVEAQACVPGQRAPAPQLDSDSEMMVDVKPASGEEAEDDVEAEEVKLRLVMWTCLQDLLVCDHAM